MGVHESKAERSSHSPTTRASRRVPSLHPRDLASFAPVPEHQDRRRGICCRGRHGTSRNAGLASLHYTVAAQATASAGFPFPLYRFRGSGCVVAGSFCAPRGGAGPWSNSSFVLWWCARAATTPEQCARADEGEMRLDRSSSGGGFISPSARDGSPSLPPISFSPCSGNS
jgi:hypothetical protein